MRDNDQFINDNFNWFLALVEDINDTEMLNRVKVRAYGYHSDDTTLVKKNDLPWATVMMPSTSASFKGNGSNHELVVGSLVVGFFRDGPSAQDPIVLGSIATQTEGTKDIPIEAQLNPPTNKVHKTEAGHLVEFDNTEGSERINIKHGTNTSTLNIDKDGITILKSTGILAEDAEEDEEPKTHTLTLNPSTNTINLLHHSGTTINISSEGTVNISSSNNTVNIVGNTTVTGTLHATGDVSTDAGNAPTLATHTHTEVPGTGGSSSPTPGTQETSVAN